MVTVMVKVTVSPTEACRGSPILESAGSIITAEVTVNISVAVLPTPPFVDDTGSLILLKVPVVVAVTLTIIVQTPPPMRLPPLKLMLLPPEIAVTVPPQLLARLSGEVFTNPSG